MNKIQVLDHGYVMLRSSSMSTKTLRSTYNSFKKLNDHEHLDLLHASIEIRCPLFVQLALSHTGLNIISGKDSRKLESYRPTVADIGGNSLEDAENIKDAIERAIEALLINPRAFQMDGCDRFISQVVSPVSVYNRILVSGNLHRWTIFTKKDGLPAPIEAYRQTIEDVLVSEWPDLWSLIRDQKDDEKTKA